MAMWIMVMSSMSTVLSIHSTIILHFLWIVIDLEINFLTSLLNLIPVAVLHWRVITLLYLLSHLLHSHLLFLKLLHLKYLLLHLNRINLLKSSLLLKNIIQICSSNKRLVIGWERILLFVWSLIWFATYYWNVVRITCSRIHIRQTLLWVAMWKSINSRVIILTLISFWCHQNKMTLNFKN